MMLIAEQQRNAKKYDIDRTLHDERKKCLNVEQKFKLFRKIQA